MQISRRGILGAGAAAAAALISTATFGGQRAMIAWLQQRSPDVWHVVAGHLNWDEATDVVEWIVSQPQCDLATAAHMFWLAEPGYWLKYPDVDAVSDFQRGGFIFCKTLADRANSGFYTRRELEFVALDPTAPIGGVDYFLKARVDRVKRFFQEAGSGPLPWRLPSVLMPPIPGRAPVVSPEENPRTGPKIRELLAELGTNVGGEETLSQEVLARLAARPQKFQIGDRVSNSEQETGTILNVNDGPIKSLYLVRLDDGREEVFRHSALTKVE